MDILYICIDLAYIYILYIYIIYIIYIYYIYRYPEERQKTES